MTVLTCPSTRRHGTPWAYQKHRCRCPQAIEKMRARWREQDHNPSGLGRRKRRRQRRSEAARYVDNLAVSLACAGDRVRLTPSERHAAINRLDTGRLAAWEIAQRLHISERTVVRHRAARRCATTAEQPVRESQ